MGMKGKIVGEINDGKIKTVQNLSFTFFNLT